MAPRVLFLLGPLAALLALSGTGLLAAPASRVTNTRVAAIGLPPYPDSTDAMRLAPFWVNEWSHGGRDLNGDGDCCSDRVAFLLSDRRQGAVNLGLSTNEGGAGFGVDDRHLAFGVFEHNQGGRDLNGDGDAADFVLHVWDDVTSRVTNVGFAIRHSKIAGGTVAFVVFEAEQGVDLNGDADVADHILLIYSVPHRRLINTTLRVGPTFDYAVAGSFVLVAVSEFGGPDLNDNGVLGEQVYFIVDVPSGVVRNLGLARAAYGGDVVASERGAAFHVWEYAQQVDLNGDGDVVDAVLHIWLRKSGVAWNSRLADGLARPAGRRVRMQDDLVGFEADERAQGGVDLNHDGDTEDALFVLAEIGPSGTSVTQRWSDVSSDSTFILNGEGAAFFIHESTHGADLNADGDRFDRVGFLWPRRQSRPTSMGQIEGANGVVLDGVTAVAATHETGGPASDLNGDGDLRDRVCFLLSGASRTSTGLAVRPFTTWLVTAREAVIPVHEADQGMDLDGDGRRSSVVLHRYDRLTGRVENLGVAADILRETKRFGVFLVRESSVTGDLNGDGDVSDAVVHQYRF